MPQGQSRVAGSNIRLAGGAVDVTASHAGATYRTSVTVGVPLSSFTIGHTLPRGASVGSVTLDGQPVAHSAVASNRGLEVLVVAPPAGSHELVVHERASGARSRLRCWRRLPDLGQPEGVARRVAEPASRSRTGAPPGVSVNSTPRPFSSS